VKLNKKQYIDAAGHLRNAQSWVIEVDYQNLDDLLECERRIRSQIGLLKNTKFGSKAEIKQRRFDCCDKIYKTNIDDIYKDIKLDSNQIYYVYAHCEPNKIAIGKDGITSWAATLGLDLIPFYIGKGTGNRAYDLNRNGTHRKVRQKFQNFKKDIEVRIIEDNVSELEALCLESKLLDIFGLNGKGGRLVNLDEGIKSAERREKYTEYLIELNSYYKNLLKVSE
jgi:hypothetical protein